MAKIHLGWPQISQIPIVWHLGHCENLKSSHFDARGALEAEKISPGPAHESVLTGREVHSAGSCLCCPKSYWYRVLLAEEGGPFSGSSGLDPANFINYPAKCQGPPRTSLQRGRALKAFRIPWGRRICILQSITASR